MEQAGRYIFALWFLLCYLSSFPRLISAVADLMSAIFPHNGVAFIIVRIYAAGLKHAARGSLKYRMQKIAIWAPSHNLSGYVFATKACIDNRKKTC